LLRPRKLKVVHTYHGHIFHSYYGAAKTRLFIAIERAMAMFCSDRILAISERQRDEICREFKVGRFDQFAVIPLGIDFDEIDCRKGRLRREIGIGDSDTLVGVVGRLCEVKNHAMLIESATKMNIAGTAFVIVGDGHLRAKLEAQAHGGGLNGRVAFTGFRDDAASLYSDFDIAALTSLNEGTPLTLIEAMSCGCAVASTEVGGVTDLMGRRRETLDGFTVWDHGVTAPSRDVETFTKGLRYLIERPDLRREMGDRGRAFVLSSLSIERLIGDIENLYCDLINDALKR
jgi:glycosyltransferase involved in cell wall biosynthesis